MISSTERKRYDSKGNIVSATTMYDSGIYHDNKRFITYDENGNISSVKNVEERLAPNGEKQTTENLTEYEYTLVDDKYMVTKVTTNGRLDAESQYLEPFTATNGDRVLSVNTKQYVYADVENESKLVNIISFHSEKCDPNAEYYVDGFDVFTVSANKNNANDTWDVYYKYGNTDVSCYHKSIVWGVNEEGDTIGSVVEAYWVEQEDSTPEKRHFKEYNSFYTVDEEGAVINKDHSILDEYLSDIVFEIKEDNRPKSITRTVETESGLPFEFKTEYIDDKDDVIIRETSTNLTTGELIVEFKKLQSTGEEIYKTYTQNDNKYYFEQIYDENGRLEEIFDQTTEIPSGKRTIRHQIFVYNEQDQKILSTIKVGDAEDPTVNHNIYEYDSEGRCITIVSEEAITYKLYDKDKEVFSVTNIGYPMCKSLFDFCYNKVLASIC